MSVGEHVGRLAEALQFRTISARIDEPDVRSAYSAFLDFVERSFPRLFEAAAVDRIDPYQLVLSLDGTSSDLEPLLLTAHYDVVEVDPATESAWTHPPFSGIVDRGYVWGRGALDDKNSLMGVLEATESLLAEGRTLERPLVLAFGGDEELTGLNGAATIARRFAEQGRHFHMVLDEGAIIAVGMLSQPNRPIALIGIAEKGQVDVELSVTTAGGHAATPPPSSALGTLARAIVHLERKPFRPRLTYTVDRFFRALSPHASFPLRVVYAYPRLFWPILRRVLQANPGANALIRTTQAVTMASASPAPNVLPQRASAVVNLRILPGESLGSVIERITRVVRPFGVDVETRDLEQAHGPIPGTPLEHPGYSILSETITGLTDCVVAPYLVTGATDSRSYASLADGVFRFVPVALDDAELAGIHSTDERISIENYDRHVEFYRQVIIRECIDG